MGKHTTEQKQSDYYQIKDQWVEYREKRNYNNKFIRKLITADEKEITNPSEILQEQFRFYSDLSQTKLKNESKAAVKNIFLHNTSIPELSQTDKRYL